MLTSPGAIALQFGPLHLLASLDVAAPVIAIGQAIGRIQLPQGAASPTNPWRGATQRRGLAHGRGVVKVLHWCTSPESSPARNQRTGWAEEHVGEGLRRHLAPRLPLEAVEVFRLPRSSSSPVDDLLLEKQLGQSIELHHGETHQLE